MLNHAHVSPSRTITVLVSGAPLSVTSSMSMVNTWDVVEESVRAQASPSGRSAVQTPVMFKPVTYKIDTIPAAFKQVTYKIYACRYLGSHSDMVEESVEQRPLPVEGREFKPQLYSRQ